MDKLKNLLKIEAERNVVRAQVNNLLHDYKGKDEFHKQLTSDKTLESTSRRLAVLESEYLVAISKLSIAEIMQLGIDDDEL